VVAGSVRRGAEGGGRGFDVAAGLDVGSEVAGERSEVEAEVAEEALDAWL